MSTAVRILQGKFGRVCLLDMDRPLVTHAHSQCHVLIKVSGEDTSFSVRDKSYPLTDHTAVLGDGYTLLLVTDGLVERRDADLDQGLATMREVLRDLGETPLEELCDTLLERMLPVDGADDVAIVAVRAHPEDRPRPPEAGPNRLPPGVS